MQALARQKQMPSQIVALNADGSPVMVTERVVARTSEDRYHAEVLTPARMAFLFGALKGVGYACAFLATYEVLNELGVIPHVLKSVQSQINTVAGIVLYCAPKHGISELGSCRQSYDDNCHNVKETPLLIEVDDTPRDTQEHLQVLRGGNASIQHVYSKGRYLPAATGDAMFIPGALIDDMKARVTGENAQTALNRDICLAMPSFYSEHGTDNRKKLYGTLTVNLEHNKYIIKRGSTFHWTEAGMAWLIGGLSNE